MGSFYGIRPSWSKARQLASRKEAPIIIEALEWLGFSNPRVTHELRNELVYFDRNEPVICTFECRNMTPATYKTGIWRSEMGRIGVGSLNQATHHVTYIWTEEVCFVALHSYKDMIDPRLLNSASGIPGKTQQADFYAKDSIVIVIHDHKGCKLGKWDGFEVVLDK